jgi:hypothetical protein
MLAGAIVIRRIDGGQICMPAADVMKVALKIDPVDAAIERLRRFFSPDNSSGLASIA